jgi:UDP-2-acetamido-3-amino-2,3-dideoxy-glucuronate N-acetyltransferase
MEDSQDFWAHPTAIVDAGANIGRGTKIWHYSHVCGEQVKIGENCSLGQNVYVGPRVQIGDSCRIQNNVSVYDLVELGRSVFCGPSVVFTNVINPRAHVPRKNEFKKTVVRQGATLGANSTIICGIEIGRFAFIAAGAVVTKDVMPFALMLGVPARHVGWMCHCGVQLQKRLGESGPVKCLDCGSEYILSHAECTGVQLKNCFEEK